MLSFLAIGIILYYLIEYFDGAKEVHRGLEKMTTVNDKLLHNVKVGQIVKAEWEPDQKIYNATITKISQSPIRVPKADLMPKTPRELTKGAKVCPPFCRAHSTTSLFPLSLS